MPEDYVAHTIAAYNASPEKYVNATAQMVWEQELDTFISMLPDISSPVLDAGCAYGRDSSLLALKGCQVVGIDMSSELLMRAKQSVPDVEFFQMDVRQLQFPPESFAGIWCNAVLLHLTDRDMAIALQEMGRVLKPGGALCVSLKEGQGSGIISNTFTSDQSRFYNFKSLRELQTILSRNGFAVRQGYAVNERQRFGSDKRDINWLYCFAVKA